MSRDINWHEAISEEDRAYALERGWDDRVAENDTRFGKDPDPAMDREQRMGVLRAEIADRTNELQRLELEAEQERNSNKSISGDPRTGQIVVDNTGVDGETPEGAPASAETYKGWPPAKLKAEIEERNKEREEANLQPLSTTGTKAELTERLLADDREIAESQQQ